MSSLSHHHHHHHHHHSHHHHRDLFPDIPMEVMRWLGFLLWGLAIIVMPLFYRGGEYWWLPINISVALFATACWMFSRAYFGRRIGKSNLLMPEPRWDWAYCVLLLPIAIGVLQCIPMPQGLLRILSCHAGEIWNSVGNGFATVTIWPEATRRRILLLLAAGLVFFATRNFCRQKKYVFSALIAVVCSTFLIALIGLLQAADSSSVVLPPFVPLGIGGETARGVFINRNHFGFLMTIGICATLGLILLINSLSVNSSNNATGIKQRKKRRIYRGVLSVVLFTLYAANTASLSRGSFISANLSLICFYLIWLKYKHKETLAQRKNTIVAIIIFVVAMLFALPPLLQKISARFDTLAREDSLSSDERLKIWSATASLIGDYWLTGVGMGAYEDAIQPYTYQGDDQLTVNAHNDYLETVAEIGVPMALLLAYLCFLLIRRLWHGLLKCSDLSMKLAGLTAFVTLIASALHEFFDFSLQAYPNAIVFAAMMGLLVAVCDDNDNEVDPVTVTTHSNKVVPLIIGTTALALLIPSCILIRASVANYAAWLIQHPAYKPTMGLGVASIEKKLKFSEKASRLNKFSSISASSYADALRTYYMECQDIVERREYTQKAYEIQKEAVKRRPANFYGWCRQANLSYDLLRFDEALQCVERAIVLAPTLVEPRLTAAWFYSSIAMWHDDATAKKYKERATELQRKILRDHQELAMKMLPSLLTTDTTAEEIIEWSHPQEELAFAILELLLKRHRFSDLKVILDNFPKESDNPELRDIRLASWKIIAEQFSENTDSESAIIPNIDNRSTLKEWLAILKRQKINQYAISPISIDGTMTAVDNVTKELLAEPLGPLPSRRLEAAKILLDVANIAGTVNVLMPLVYPNPIWEPTGDELEKAYALVSTLKANRDTSDGFKLEALRQMLKIKIGLANNNVPEENLDILTELARQYWEKRIGKRNDFSFGKISWLQSHLMDYYIGICAEARNDLETAIASYCRIQQNFPTNSTAVNQLINLAPERLTGAALLVKSFTTNEPIGFIGAAIGIVSVDVNPKSLNELHEKLEIEVTIKMYDSTTVPVAIKAQLSTEQGVFATIPLTPFDKYQHNSLLWEQGAIIRLHGVLTNALTTAVTHGKKLDSKNMVIEFIQDARNRINPRLFMSLPIRDPRKK